MKNELISGRNVLNHRLPTMSDRRGGCPMAIYHRGGRLAAVNGQEALLEGE